MEPKLIHILFFFYLSFADIRAQCPCAGLKVSLEDQLHCFEILNPSSNTWIDADRACAARGGFMAHVNTSDLYAKLSAFLKQNYKKPILTGTTVGNPELKLLAMMCPANTYSSMMEESAVDALLSGTPDLSRRCVFFQGSDSKLSYEKCDQDAQVLCDFPMEKPNYCNSQMNCSSTTTTTTSIWTTTTNAFSTTTTAGRSSTTTTVPPNGTSPPVVPPVVPGAQTSTQKAGVGSTTTTVPTTTTTKQQTTTTTSSANATTTTTSGKSTTTVKVTTRAPVSSTPANSKKCGSGYSSFAGWCVPWWAWLLFALLLILLLLCCLCWLLHLCCACCMCLLPARPVNVERQRPHGIDKEMQTIPVQTRDSGMNHDATPSASIPPSPPKVPLHAAPVASSPLVYEIVEKNEIIFAPIPHAAMNDPGMLLPPGEVDADRASTHSLPLHVETRKERPIDKSHLRQPELAAMAAMAAARIPPKKEPTIQELPYSLPPNGKMRPDMERPSTRSSILTISPERSPHEVPSTPVNGVPDRSPPRPFQLGPLPQSQNRKSPKQETEPHRSRPEKRRERPAFPPPAQENRSPDEQPVKRAFPSKQPARSPTPLDSPTPFDSPRRSFPANSPDGDHMKPPPSSLSSKSLFDKDPPRGMGRGSRAPKDNKNLRAVDKPAIQKDLRGMRGGGVVGGNAPNEWKPWSKTAGTFSKNPGFLDD
uniref:C-type lectin domain-containing protein n=1 Tax=Steinernema glaseri TaxID=37863 RepID=A0A1I7ZEL7_9BILA